MAAQNDSTSPRHDPSRQAGPLEILRDCCTIRLTKGLIALVDRRDWREIQAIKWFVCESAPGRFYAVRYTRYGFRKYKHEFLHRVLMGSPPRKNVDHRNGDTLDCRRDNLRICTHSQNSWNQRPKGGSSKYKGVYWCKRSRTWRAQTVAAGRKIALGAFKMEEDAARAYDRAVLAEAGEFARTNASIFGDI